MKINLIALVSLFLFYGYTVNAQLETSIFSTENRDTHRNDAYFFTNRPILVNEDNSYTFQNRSTDKTNTLYFCTYDFETDSIDVNYRTINLSDKYPSGKI